MHGLHDPWSYSRSECTHVDGLLQACQVLVAHIARVNLRAPVVDVQCFDAVLDVCLQQFLLRHHPTRSCCSVHGPATGLLVLFITQWALISLYISFYSENSAIFINKFEIHLQYATFASSA